jgi:RsiW-degrading membrane proteinase PrsW (M82 family)
MLQPEFAAITLAAFIPTLIAAAIVGRLSPPGERSWVGLLVALLWGAAGAVAIASPLNDLAGALGATLVGAETARWIVPAFVGPAIEELAKATGFLAVAAALAGARGVDRRPTSVRSAIVIGALIGFGFAAAENVRYYTMAAVMGGPIGFVRAVYLRGLLQSGNHAAFTATVGAGVGWAWTRATSTAARLAAIGLGLTAAIGLHVLWNGIVSDEIMDVLCNAPSPGAACAAAPDAVDLLVGVPAIEAVFLVPIAAVLARIARRDKRQQVSRTC